MKVNYIKTDLELIEKFNNIFLKNIIEELSVRQKITVTIKELFFLKNFTGYLIGRDINKILYSELFYKIDLNKILWNYNENDLKYEIKLNTDFSAQEIESLNNMLGDYSDLIPESNYFAKVIHAFIKRNPNCYAADRPEIIVKPQIIDKILNEEIYEFLKGNIKNDLVEAAFLLHIPLTLQNYYSIAFVLNYFNPDEDLLNIADEELVKLINEVENLPEKITSQNKDLIETILYSWINIRDNFDDSMWDSEV